MISTQPPSGFRDFLNAQASRRLKLKRIIADVYESFGFLPLETSALENLEILVGSGGGQENEKLIFKVLKRGDKLKEEIGKSDANENSLADYGMRFDLTLPLSRAVANYRNEIVFPWKVFQMGQVWRAERPQKGRFREFTQCDVDIIGSESSSAELQVIEAVTHAAAAAGADGFELRINDRRLIQAMAASGGNVEMKVEDVAIILDKKDKISATQMLEELREIYGGRELPGFVVKAAEGSLNFEDARKLNPEVASQLETLMKNVEALKLPLKSVVYDPSLARGLGYYTGTIYELRHASAGYSLGGGGRYDHLIGRFSKQAYPACGFSIGFDRLLLLLEEKEKASEANQSGRVFLPVMDEKLRMQVHELAQNLRAQAIQADVFPDEAKLKNQMKFAESSKYRWVLIAGEEEFKKGEFNLKDFSARSEQALKLSEIMEHLKRTP